MFNDSAFAKMKKGARIINVARGGVIDDDALARALDAGIVASAALDVFEEEPPKFEGHPLINRCDSWSRPPAASCLGFISQSALQPDLLVAWLHVDAKHQCCLVQMNTQHDTA
jgi:lactate dehydrogenase-like 2-hydroxyacid dehydrogenase